MFCFSGGEDFDVRPSYVNNQHVQLAASLIPGLQPPKDFEGIKP
jgi:hypothetical protein